MAFSADELRVLRRALAVALHPVPVPAEDVQKCLRLADALDEATREADRLRGFVLADLARYREALPGTASGYFALLRDALAAGYVPGPDDLAALRALRANPVAAALLAECRTLAERSVRARLSAASAAPSPRARLLAFPTARAAKGEPPGPVRKPEPKDPEP
ncbi:hypothetical protein, partial [Streptomyces sp. GC420]|uniref:hypothetical protein n=1 Tax=Streptomyces sp. GC420 TaxID=2697568 RepID=UPI001414FD5C